MLYIWHWLRPIGDTITAASRRSRSKWLCDIEYSVCGRPPSSKPTSCGRSSAAAAVLTSRHQTAGKVHLLRRPVGFSKARQSMKADHRERSIFYSRLSVPLFVVGILENTSSHVYSQLQSRSGISNRAYLVPTSRFRPARRGAVKFSAQKVTPCDLSCSCRFS